MSKKSKKRSTRTSRITGIIIIIIVTVFITYLPKLKGFLNETEAQQVESTYFNSSGELYVHYLDVGQGDSIVAELPNGQVMMIDAGNNEESDRQVIDSMLKSKNIVRIDYMIFTHPHEDHIGSGSYVVKNYDIINLYMPKVSTTTKVYENLLNAIKDRGLKIKAPVSGSYIINEDGLSIQILAPNSAEYKDLNNYSIVLKLIYGKTIFIFAGDAQTESEKEILQKGYNIKCDVLKVGHHGSDTSSTDGFIKNAAPEYAVISVGKDNNYGLPDDSIIKRLEKYNCTVLRTDKLGTISFISNGNTVSQVED